MQHAPVWTGRILELVRCFFLIQERLQLNRTVSISVEVRNSYLIYSFISFIICDKNRVLVCVYVYRGSFWDIFWKAFETFFEKRLIIIIIITSSSGKTHAWTTLHQYLCRDQCHQYWKIAAFEETNDKSPGRVGYISHVHWAYEYLGPFGVLWIYIWLDTKIVLKMVSWIAGNQRRSFKTLQL